MRPTETHPVALSTSEALVMRVPAPLPPWVSPESDVQIQDIARAIYRRKWLVLSIIVGTIAAAAVYAAAATRVYRARATVVIDPEISTPFSAGEPGPRQPVRPDYYQTQYDILRSRALARAALDGGDLWTAASLANATRSRTAGIGEFFAWARPPADAPPAEQPADARDSAREARVIQAFLSRLSVVPHAESRIVEIGWQSPDPALAARAANALARAYIRHNVDIYSARARGASDALQQEVDQQRGRMFASERALQQYREQNDVLRGRQDISLQKLADLNAALTRARTERIEKEALYSKLAVLGNDAAAIDTFSGALSNAYIQQLKFELTTLQRQEAEASARLGDGHPEMLKIRSAIQVADAKLRNELGKVVQAARNDFLTAEAQERNLASALEAQKQEVLKDGRKAIEYDTLERTAASDRQLLDALSQRAKEAAIAGQLAATNIRILDVAEPPSTPIWPRPNLILLIAALLGTSTALLAVLSIEYLGDRLNTPEQIRTYLHLRPLGVLPQLPTPDLTVPGAAALDSAASQFSERFRFVRANALSSPSHRQNRCFVVTSTGMGEGKTVVAGNLAAALSRPGDRVLLVDADMRSPSVHELLGHTRAPGLADLLQNTASPSEVVQRSSIPNLFVVSAGSETDRSADLLASRGFKEALGHWLEAFQWVVIDSPPLMPVVDASLVAHAGSELLLVVGAGQTSRRAARVAVEQLQSAGVAIAGVVLNRADVRDADQYSRYYGRAYGKGRETAA